MKESLLKKIDDKSCKVGVVGLGYVGLPLALQFAESGFSVLGFDVDQAKVEQLALGNNYLKHLGDARVRAAVSAGCLIPSSRVSLAREADALILCVPTPLGPHLEPDMQYVRGSLDALSPYLRPGQLLALESTTYPGTTREIVAESAARAGLSVGQDVFVVYSPEREDPGNREFQTGNTPKLLGGMSQACLEVGVALYSAAVAQVIAVSSPEVAEMAKLLENIYRAVNIGLVNELKVCCDKMGIDIWEVIDAAATKPFGFTPFYPGPGLGGHCIPIDPYYLTWKAQEYGVNTRFIALAGEVNRSMPAYVIAKLAECLNRCGKSVNGSKVLVLGIAYKRNVDDLRESPAFEIIESLIELGADVSYSDPHVPETPKTRRHSLNMKSLPLDRATISGFDALVLTTDHDAFDYGLILEHASLIVDTRGRFRNGGANVVRA